MQFSQDFFFPQFSSRCFEQCWVSVEFTNLHHEGTSQNFIQAQGIICLTCLQNGSSYDFSILSLKASKRRKTREKDKWRKGRRGRRKRGRDQGPCPLPDPLHLSILDCECVSNQTITYEMFPECSVSRFCSLLLCVLMTEEINISEILCSEDKHKNPFKNGTFHGFRQDRNLVKTTRREIYLGIQNKRCLAHFVCLKYL